jgi:hypothetical protein
MRKEIKRKSPREVRQPTCGLGHVKEAAGGEQSLVFLVALRLILHMKRWWVSDEQVLLL